MASAKKPVDRRPIEVVATRPGYYGKLRAEGDKFIVRGEADLGSWMAPTKTSVPEGPSSDGAGGVESLT